MAALVYIAAVPDKGKWVNRLLGGFPIEGPQRRFSRRKRLPLSSTVRSSTLHSRVTLAPNKPRS